VLVNWNTPPLYCIACVDAFALAKAERLALPLIPIDHCEFDAVEKKDHFRSSF